MRFGAEYAYVYCPHCGKLTLHRQAHLGATSVCVHCGTGTYAPKARTWRLATRQERYQHWVVQ